MSYDIARSGIELNHIAANQDSIALVDSLIEHIRFMSEYYGGDYVAIGGMAIYCHLAEKGKLPSDFTHDGDVVISPNAFFDLRNDFDVNANPRLGKFEYKIEDSKGQSIDIDLYKEYTPNCNLTLPASDIIKHAVEVSGVFCANKVHLLALKLDRYANYDGSREGPKADKMDRDIILLFSIFEKQDVDSTLWQECMTPERLRLLEHVLQKTASLEFGGHIKTCVVNDIAKNKANYKASHLNQYYDYECMLPGR